VAPTARTPLVVRFAVEFGPFATTADAERVERQLIQAGHQTARFRQPTGAGLYSVLLERLPAGRDAEALAATLREQGFAEAAVARPDPPAVRLGEPAPLRGAVELAERARALGYAVRVAAQPGEAVAYVIRHGNFASRLEAEAKAAELGRLGLSHQVIQVR
jgi:cell division protein FtsN